jgi:predicted ester cyclase
MAQPTLPSTAPTTTTSTAASNVALMHTIVFSIQQSANYALIDTLVHPSFINHTPAPGLPSDRTGVHAVMRYIHSAFANVKMEIVQCVSEGNVIATNKILRGDHVGEWLGSEPDGRRKRVRIMDFVTVQDGLMREHWATIGGLEVEE